MIPRISRRLFLGASAAGALAAKTFVPQNLGVELYTVRNLMPKDDDAVLKSIADIGYKELEGDYPTLLRIAPKAKSLGLAMPACHIPTPAVLGTWDIWKGMDTLKSKGLEQILTDLKGIGATFAVIPYLQMAERKPEVLKSFGEKMTRAGETARKVGMQLAYHNHAFEFGELEDKRIFDVMFAGTSPKIVQLEADVFWLSVAGQNPAEFITKHADRVKLTHLKDKNPSQKNQYSESVPKEAFQAVGKGSIDFKSVLEACRKAGVKHYFVEQDQTPGDPLASLRDSYQYLSGLRA
jgi:sugar phosphate isomerase/epimerase